MTDVASVSADSRAVRAVWIIAVLGGAWLVAHTVGWLGPLSILTFPLLTFTAVAAIVFGVRRHRPDVAWPWYWLAAGFVLFLVGGIVRVSLHTLGDLSSHRSIVPDLITIPGYILSA